MMKPDLMQAPSSTWRAAQMSFSLQFQHEGDVLDHRAVCVCVSQSANMIHYLCRACMTERRVKTFQCGQGAGVGGIQWIQHECPLGLEHALWSHSRACGRAWSRRRSWGRGSTVRRVTFQRGLSWQLQLKNLLTKRACRWRVEQGKYGWMDEISAEWGGETGGKWRTDV